MAQLGTVDELAAALEAGQNVDGWTLPTYSREFRDQATSSPNSMGARQRDVITSEQRVKLAARLAPFKLRYRLVITFREETRKRGRGYNRQCWPIGWWTITIRVGWWSYWSWRLSRWFTRVMGTDDPEIAKAIGESIVAAQQDAMRL